MIDTSNDRVICISDEDQLMVYRNLTAENDVWKTDLPQITEVESK